MVGEAVIILACRRASFLGRLLLALPFLRLAGLSQKAFEELTILIDVLDGVGVVGAWTLHELVEVDGLALLGLLAAWSATATKAGLAGRRRSFLFFLPFCVEGHSPWSSRLALPLS